MSSKAFSGSDTLVTAKILASAIKKYVPDFNLIITGNIAIDGDTAQVPVSLAQLLLIPYLTVAYEEADDLSDTERGGGGFGSTGMK